MTIEAAGTGIKNSLAGITTLRQVFAPNELPKSPNVFPCAMIIPGNINYLQDLTGAYSVTLRVLVLMAPVETKQGMDTILPLMETTGTMSIYAALMTDRTLGGNASDCLPTTCSGIGSTDWSGTSYLSTEMQVEVYL